MLLGFLPLLRTRVTLCMQTNTRMGRRRIECKKSAMRMKGGRSQWGKSNMSFKKLRAFGASFSMRWDVASFLHFDEEDARRSCFLYVNIPSVSWRRRSKHLLRLKDPFEKEEEERNGLEERFSERRALKMKTLFPTRLWFSTATHSSFNYPVFPSL